MRNVDEVHRGVPLMLAEPYGPACSAQPEVRLMHAVLEDAARILLHRRQAWNSLVRETVQWVVSDDTSWPFSFVNVCEALRIDGGRIRVMLLADRGRARCGPAPKRRAVAPARGSVAAGDAAVPPMAADQPDPRIMGCVA